MDGHSISEMGDRQHANKICYTYGMKTTKSTTTWGDHNRFPYFLDKATEASLSLFTRLTFCLGKEVSVHHPFVLRNANLEVLALLMVVVLRFSVAFVAIFV